MAVSRRHVDLAKTLPMRLQKFFALNPPSPIVKETVSTEVKSMAASPVEYGPSKSSKYMNPFLPHKHPKTGRWHPPIYSLRRQAELVKLAQKYSVDDLLPYTPKHPAVKAKKREEQGLRVKGTGVGQRVKGHLWERTMKGRLEKRRQAMLDMPALIQQWKQRGHGRGWTKWPSGKREGR